MINLARLQAELSAAGLSAAVALHRSDADRSPWPAATWLIRPEGVVRVDWSSPPTAQQEAQAATSVAAHDGTPTEGERLDEANVPPRVMACLLIRASSHWAGLSAGRKARVMAVIDAAAEAAVAKLT
jgi:hypothetical protein